jgi:hypothetical protein
MTKRERNLALVILAILVVFGGAFFAYFFYLEPLRQKEASIALTRTQIADRRQRIAEVQANFPKLERWRYLSLPGDTSLAMREYDNYLRELLKQSGFSADAISRIDTKQADTRSSPALPGKKEPIYTVLSFNVVARGQLTNLTKLLEGFYRTGLLQRIKTMTVQRPMTTTASQRPGELDINLTIEALIVSGANSRPYLIPLDRRALAVEAVSALRQGPAGLGWLLAAAEPTGPLGPRVLAEPARQYASLGDKNIFYGPPPPPPPPPPPKQSTPGMDMTQFTFLTDIVHSELRGEAFFYDRLNNSRTRLRNSAGFDTFRIRDSNGDTQVQGKIVRMDERDIIFVASDRYYAIHVGQSMKDALAKPLSAEQIKELGLPALKTSK